MSKGTVNNVVRSAMIVALCALLGGCFSFNPGSLRRMEDALEESNPNLEIESTMKFGVGALTMDFVDFAFVHDSNIDLSKISRADIGIYELKHALAADEFVMPQGGDRNCPQREVIMRVNDDDEHVEFAVCIRKDKIVGFALFSLDKDELVVMSTRGDFEALISSAIRQNVKRKES
jgi:hypothetical protein